MAADNTVGDRNAILAFGLMWTGVAVYHFAVPRDAEVEWDQFQRLRRKHAQPEPPAEAWHVAPVVIPDPDGAGAGLVVALRW